MQFRFVPSPMPPGSAIGVIRLPVSVPSKLMHSVRELGAGAPAPNSRFLQEVTTMHPAGIKFGLSQGLLELNGAGVVLSPPLLESISEMARRKVRRRKRVIWIWDDAVSAGIGKIMP